MNNNCSSDTSTVLVLHPGKMGATIGLAAQRNGYKIICTTGARSRETRDRVSNFGFTEIENYCEAFAQADVVFSICMGSGVFPNIELAIEHGFQGIFVDANHIGSPELEKQARRMLRKAGIRYVEASIYGWPYSTEVQGPTERICYLTGQDAPRIRDIVNGDIFSCVVTETELGAKEIKRMREEMDRKVLMPHTDHGYGIVEFHNVIDVNKDFIEPWLERRMIAEPQDYTVDSNGFYINRGGYKFTKEQIESAPRRYMNLSPAGAPDEDKEFHLRLEKAMFDCINAYSCLYPEVKDCLWWRTDAHVAVYGVGAGMGLHHDNAIGGAAANENPIFNVVSGSLILHDECTGGELEFRFIKNKIAAKSGSAVFYPSSYMGSHAVSKITNGKRISYLEFFGHGSHPGQTKKL